MNQISTPDPAAARTSQPSPPVGFALAVLPHLGAGYNLARWLLGDPTLANDVVQDAALRAIRYFESYQGGDARAWFLRIVRNTAYGSMSAQQRLGTVSLGEPGATDEDDPPAYALADPSGDPETIYFGQELLRGLNKTLASLPIELRECLVLRAVEELSYSQIAQVTGVPVGTVMSRLWRARQALAAVQA